MSLSLWNSDPFFDNSFPFTTLTPFRMTHLAHVPSNPTKDLTQLLKLDLVESDGDFHIHADLPGVQPEDLDISIVDNNKYLVLAAERKFSYQSNDEDDQEDETTAPSTHKIHSMERSFGNVQRKIRLPANADVEKASTSLKNGVLTVTLPKKVLKDEPAVRKLSVNVEN